MQRVSESKSFFKCVDKNEFRLFQAGSAFYGYLQNYLVKAKNG